MNYSENIRLKIKRIFDDSTGNLILIFSYNFWIFNEIVLIVLILEKPGRIK